MMTLSSRIGKDRDSGRECLNFDATIFTRAEATKAILALQALRDLLPDEDRKEAQDQ